MVDEVTSPIGAGESQRRRNGFYRLEANHSSASVFEDVEMAHDEVRCRAMVADIF
jgi:hypothetical protein